MNKYINEYNQKQQAKLRKMQKASPKECWKYLNRFNKQSEPNQPPLKSFVHFFKNLNTLQPDSNEEESLTDEILNNIDLNDETQFLNVPITVEEISKCIKKHGCKVSSGQSLLTPGGHCSLLAVAQQSLLAAKISLLSVTAAHCQKRTVTSGHCQQSLLPTAKRELTSGHCQQ